MSGSGSSGGGALWLRVVRDTIALPGVVAGLVPWFLAREASGFAPVDLGPLAHAGWLAIVLGLAGYAACASNFAREGRGTPAPWDAPRELVVTGPYRWVRNPMYVSVLLLLAGQALVRESAAIALWAATAATAFHTSVVLHEEPRLGRLFGASFERYRASVPRWLPRRPRPESGSDHE